MFQGLVNWALGGVLCVASLTGLFLAAKGTTQDSYYFGLGLCALSVIGLVTLVRNALDKADQH